MFGKHLEMNFQLNFQYANLKNYFNNPNDAKKEEQQTKFDSLPSSSSSLAPYA